jgi:hypothetical protein
MFTECSLQANNVSFKAADLRSDNHLISLLLVGLYGTMLFKLVSRLQNPFGGGLGGGLTQVLIVH